MDSNCQSPNKISASFLLATSALVAILVTAFLFNSLYGAITSGNAPYADGIGRIFGRLWMNGMLSLIGYGFAFALFKYGMSNMFPRTHSLNAKLQQLYDSTEGFVVSDHSEDGFYRNATEYELSNFYNRLSKTPSSPKFAALVLEIRRRLNELDT